MARPKDLSLEHAWRTVHGPKVRVVQRPTRCGSMKARPSDRGPEATPEVASMWLTSTDHRKRATEDVAAGDILLRVLPRGRGAVIPGTGRRPGQTVRRARGLSRSNSLRPTTDPRVYQVRRHLHHTGCRISGIGDGWRIRRGRQGSRDPRPSVMDRAAGPSLLAGPAGRAMCGIR
jgi:hypothetical protein